MSEKVYEIPRAERNITQGEVFTVVKIKGAKNDISVKGDVISEFQFACDEYEQVLFFDEFGIGHHLLTEAISKVSLIHRNF